MTSRQEQKFLRTSTTEEELDQQLETLQEEFKKRLQVDILEDPTSILPEPLRILSKSLFTTDAPKDIKLQLYDTSDFDINEGKKARMYKYSDDIKKIKQYDAAIFFDNSKKHIDTIKSKYPKIQTVKIDEESSHVPATRERFVELFKLSEPEIIEEYYNYETKDMEIITDNSYINLITKVYYPPADYYDAKSGIQEPIHEKIITDWMMSINRQRRNSPDIKAVAMFDWDRTITVVEGMKIKSSAQKTVGYYELFTTPEKFLEDLLIYTCGGRDRLQFLRDTFRELYEQDIDILVLTNNSSCGNSIFGEILVKLFAGYVPMKRGNEVGYYYICSREHSNDKYLALEENYGYAFSKLK